VATASLLSRHWSPFTEQQAYTGPIAATVHVLYCTAHPSMQPRQAALQMHGGKEHCLQQQWSLQYQERVLGCVQIQHAAVGGGLLSVHYASAEDPER
jgi:hypothetical protein